VILDKVRYVYDNYKGYVGPFSRVVGYIIAGVFEYGAGRPTEALIHLHRFLENVYEPDYGEYLLISPAFVLPPYVIIGCVLLILLRDRGGFDRLVAILSHYAKNEYASAISGKKAVEQLMNELWKDQPHMQSVPQKSSLSPVSSPSPPDMPQNMQKNSSSSSSSSSSPSGFFASNNNNPNSILGKFDSFLDQNLSSDSSGGSFEEDVTEIGKIFDSMNEKKLQEAFGQEWNKF